MPLCRPPARPFREHRTEPTLLQFQSISIGPETATLRENRIGGRVLAVLHNALYVGGNNWILGIVGEDAPDGPISVRVHHLPQLLTSVEGRDGASVEVTLQGISIGNVVRIDWGNAEQWQPPFPSLLRAMETTNPAASRLAALLSGTRISADNSNPLFKHISSALTAFALTAQQCDSTGAAQALVALLGLGPGLTPTGDDIVAGLLACLVWRARLAELPASFVECLTDVIEAEAPERTNRVSACLLHYACRGILYAPAMDLGSALLAGKVDQVDAPARSLLKIGATTGSDLVVGLLFAALLGHNCEALDHSRVGAQLIAPF
jgi:hypothetical protein